MTLLSAGHKWVLNLVTFVKLSLFERGHNKQKLWSDDRALLWKLATHLSEILSHLYRIKLKPTNEVNQYTCPAVTKSRSMYVILKTTPLCYECSHELRWHGLPWWFLSQHRLATQRSIYGLCHYGGYSLLISTNYRVLGGQFLSWTPCNLLMPRSALCSYVCDL